MTLRVILAGLILSTAAHAEVVGIQCSRDERATDGPLEVYQIRKIGTQIYKVTFSTTISNMGEPKTDTLVLMRKATCEFDTKELVGECTDTSNKESQKYLHFSSRVSRFYDTDSKKVVQSPLMLDIRFDDFTKPEVARPIKLETKYFKLKTECALIQR